MRATRRNNNRNDISICINDVPGMSLQSHIRINICNCLAVICPVEEPPEHSALPYYPPFGSGFMIISVVCWLSLVLLIGLINCY